MSFRESICEHLAKYKVDVLGVEELYHLCALTRTRVCVGEHAVGRVIGRAVMLAGGAVGGQKIGEERREI